MGGSACTILQASQAPPRDKGTTYSVDIFYKYYVNEKVTKPTDSLS